MQAKPAHGPKTPRLGHYSIDTGASTITFKTRHLFGIAPVRGTFAIQSGTVRIAEPIGESTIHVEVDATSVRSGDERRDTSVRSARLLDTDTYPTMTFDAADVDNDTVTGLLTVGGTTRQVSLTIERSAVSAHVFTAHATTRIDRTDFGVTAYRGLAGRYLDIALDIKCVHA